jgi:hypothetical protein
MVSDIANLSNVKQLNDQMVASGTHLGFEDYLALLLSAGSKYDKTYAAPCSGQLNV